MAFRKRSAADADTPLPSYVPRSRRVTTAWTLAAYRDELRACGFSEEVAHELVVLAAKGQSLVTDLMFEVHAQPPYPVVWREDPGEVDA